MAGALIQSNTWQYKIRPFSGTYLVMWLVVPGYKIQIQIRTLAEFNTNTILGKKANTKQFAAM